MKDERKTKEQLVNELVEMRRGITELEKSETQRKRAEQVLRESEDLELRVRKRTADRKIR